MTGARLLVFDLETYRTRDPAVIARIADEAVEKRPPGNVSKHMKAEWDTEEERDRRVAKAIADTSLDVTLAEPILCAWRTWETSDPEDDLPMMMGGEDHLAWKPEDERKNLERLFLVWSELTTQDTIWVGFNIDGYDLPILLNRARLHGVRPPEHFPQFARGRWRGRTFDLMQRVPAKTRFISMDRALEMYGIEQAEVLWDGTPIDGSRVGEIYEVGTQKAVVALENYCTGDVIGNMKLYLAMTFGDTWGTYDRGMGEQMRAILDATALTVAEKAMALYSLVSSAGVSS